MSLRDREKRDPCGLVDLGGGVCPEDVRPRLCVLAGAVVRGEAGTKHRGQNQLRDPGTQGPQLERHKSAKIAFQHSFYLAEK